MGEEKAPELNSSDEHVIHGGTKTSFIQCGIRMISEGRGFDLIKLLYLLHVLRQTGLSKQCRPRSGTAEHGVESGSTLFATHLTILHTF